MNLMNRLKNARRLRNIAAAAIIPVALAALAMISTAPASATATAVRPANYYPSIVYTQPGRPKALAGCVEDCGNYVTIQPNNDDAVHMICYYNVSPAYDGNYSSTLWFHVYLNGWPGEWWIHSSYIYYQTKVGAC